MPGWCMNRTCSLSLHVSCTGHPTTSSTRLLLSIWILAGLARPVEAAAAPPERVSYAASFARDPAFIILGEGDTMHEDMRRKTVDAAALRLSETVPPDEDRQTSLCPDSRPRVLVGSVSVRSDLAALEAMGCVVEVTGDVTIFLVDEGAPVVSLPRLARVGGELSRRSPGSTGPPASPAVPA